MSWLLDNEPCWGHFWPFLHLFLALANGFLIKKCMFLRNNLSQTTQHFQTEECFLEKLLFSCGYHG